MAKAKRFPAGRHRPLILLLAVIGSLVLAACQSEAPRRTGTPQAAANLASPTLTATATMTPIIATATPASTLTATGSPSPAATDMPSRTATPTRTPTVTLTPSQTPTSRPQFGHFPVIVASPEASRAGPASTPPTAVPSPAPTFAVGNHISNVLLLGTDNPLVSSGGSGLADTLIVVSINYETQTASMISLPRDLYVYIPGWQMDRLNTAIRSSSYPGGGIARLKDTILYNFGIPIHYYAQIDFNGFKQVVDAIGGVDIAVSCRLKDWRLKSPGLESAVAENWEEFSLEPGFHHMDGDTALWYVRSRLSTTDFDRGRRQQQFLRSILNQGVDLNLLPQIPILWETYQGAVQTDIDIGRLLQWATLAPAVRENGVQHLYLVYPAIQSWTVPETGAQVQLPQWEGDGGMYDVIRRLFLPPALNRATREPLTVEVINGTGNPDLARLAADNLSWYGFAPVMAADPGQTFDRTAIRLYADNNKGSYDWLLSWIFRRRAGDVEIVPGVAHETNYQVHLGTDYDPCLDQLRAPRLFLDP